MPTRRLLLSSLVALGVAAGPSRAAAQVDRYLGTPVTSVRVEAASGTAVDDPQVLALVETRAGQPLAMVHVRDTITQLMTLGRYDDVVAEATSGPLGLDLVYRVTPALAISRIEFSGGLRLDEARLRDPIRERVGRTPRPSAVPDIRAVVLDVYRSEGYFKPEVTARLDAPDAAGRMTLRMHVAPGPRAIVAAIDIEGQPPGGRAQLLKDLRLAEGRPWDAAALQKRIERWIDRQRQKGHYEATLRAGAEPRADLERVDVRLVVDLGPIVELVFSGDPLPPDRQRELVPIQREGTADEDLLEDAKRRIEDELRAQGYWRAMVDYERTERDGRLTVEFTITRGAQYFVSDLDLVGVQQLPRAEIAQLFRTRVAEPFVRSTLDDDVATLLQHYRLKGFAEAKVTPAVVEGGTTGAAGGATAQVLVRVVVEEGPRTLIEDLRFSGRREVPDADLRAVIKLAPGAPFYAPQVAADRDALRLAYENRGFREATVSDTVERGADPRGVVLTYTIVEGPLAVVDEVIIVGNTRTGTGTILRALQLATGDPLGLDDLADAQRRLAELGLFRRVRVEDRAVPGRAARDVVVTVDEAPATNIGYGGGIEVGQRLVSEDSSDGTAVEQIDVAPRAFFEIGRRNLWGKNRSVNFFSRVSLRRSNEDATTTDPGAFGFNEYRVVGSYREPQAFGRRHADLLVAAFLEQAIRTSFSYRRSGVNADLTWHRPGPYTLVGRYTLGRTTTFDERYNPSEQPIIDRLFPQVRLSVVSGIVVRDTRNDVLDPERGMLLTADTALAARALGSEVGYVKTLGQAFAFRRLPGPRRFVLAGGLRLGLANGFARTVVVTGEDGQPIVGPGGEEIATTVDDLPASERFYAGGATTVRGFSQDRLGDTGTIDQDGFPTGGNGLLIVNGEIRVPVWRSVGAALFVDTGNVFLRASDIDLGRLRTTVGFGLRYRSPIGPLRVDLGFKTDRQVSANGTRERGYVVHISLGEAF